MLRFSVIVIVITIIIIITTIIIIVIVIINVIVIMMMRGVNWPMYFQPVSRSVCPLLIIPTAIIIIIVIIIVIVNIVIIINIYFLCFVHQFKGCWGVGQFCCCLQREGGNEL